MTLSWLGTGQEIIGVKISGISVRVRCETVSYRRADGSNVVIQQKEIKRGERKQYWHDNRHQTRARSPAMNAVMSYKAHSGADCCSDHQPVVAKISQDEVKGQVQISDRLSTAVQRTT